MQHRGPASGALRVAINPVGFVSPPATKPPDPRPPRADEAARNLDEAWRDPDGGTLVWLTMTTGLRRGELCALRWSHIDLPNGTVTVRRSISQDGVRRDEKDTKTHRSSDASHSTRRPSTF